MRKAGTTARQEEQDWPDDLPLQHFLTYRLALLTQALNRQATDILRQSCGLTLTQWRVLAITGAAEKITSTEIAKRTEMDPGLLSRTISSLDALGLMTVERRPEDRRQLNLTLTEEGMRRYRDALPIMRLRQRRLLASLDASERAVVFGIVEKLLHAAEDRDFIA